MKLTNAAILELSRANISTDDLMHLVDISDTTHDPAGTSKKIQLSAILNPLNQITINHIDDFDVQDGTTITLEAGKSYKPGAAITTSKRWIVGNNSSIVGDNPVTDLLWHYTGTGNMFTGVDVGFFTMANFAYRCPTAQIFDFSDTVPGTSVFNINTITGYAANPSSLIADKFGTFTDMAAVVIDNCSASFNGLGVEDGITLGGAQQIILSINKLSIVSLSATYVGLDLGSVVVSNAFEISNMVNVGITAGSVGMTGLVSSGNIGTSIIGKIRDCEFIGAITPLTNLTRSDIRLEFKDSSPVQNSSKTVDTFLSASQQVTNPGSGTFVDIGGTNWVSDVSERFTTSTAGVVTYIGKDPVEVLIVATATLEKSGGGTDILALRIRHESTGLVKSESPTENSTATNVTSIALITVANGDEVAACVANLSSSTTPGGDPVVSHCNVSIINGL